MANPINTIQTPLCLSLAILDLPRIFPEIGHAHHCTDKQADPYTSCYIYYGRGAKPNNLAKERIKDRL